MNQKIMAIIKSQKGNFLILKTNPKHMKVNQWFVITGSVKSDESDEEAVAREVGEETGLEILKIQPTNLSFEYEWPLGSGKIHHEKAFLVTVEEGPVKLNRWEHLDYKWLGKGEFLKTIAWQGDKIGLGKILARSTKAAEDI